MNMTRFAQGLTALAVALSLFIYTPASKANTAFQTGTALRVYDGDTITLSPTESIRLACIDAPELKQVLGPQARLELLSQIAKGSQFAYVPTNSKDLYGRTVALVYRDKNSHSVQEFLVSKGLAIVYEQYQKGCPTAQLRALQVQAQNSRLGLWAQPLACLPQNFRKKLCQ